MISATAQPHEPEEIRLKSLYFKPIKWVFYLIFSLAFLLSGFLTIIDVFPYRMGLATIFILPLFFFKGFKFDYVTVFYIPLTIVVIISAIYNNSTLLDLFLFLRVIIFSFLIYYLVKVFVTTNNIKSIIQLCVLVGMVQLPLVVFQILTYDWLPIRITSDLSYADYDFGTFNYKGDYSMTFFLILLVIFLLFDKKRNYIIRHRTFVVIWLTLTVFIANADIAKGIIIITWGFYFLIHLNRKIGIYLLIILAFGFALILASGFWSKVGEDLTNKVVLETQSLISGDRVNVYLSGGYARGAALYYFFTNDLLLVGDGPSKYVDPITRERIRGNVGHIFTFYSEVGLLGWLFSMIVFFQVAFKYQRGLIRVTWVNMLAFMSIFILSFTSQIMNDISVVLIYCLITKTNLIPPNPAYQKAKNKILLTSSWISN